MTTYDMITTLFTFDKYNLEKVITDSEGVTTHFIFDKMWERIDLIYQEKNDEFVGQFFSYGRGEKPSLWACGEFISPTQFILSSGGVYDPAAGQGELWFELNNRLLAKFVADDPENNKLYTLSS